VGVLTVGGKVDLLHFDSENHGTRLSSFNVCIGLGSWHHSMVQETFPPSSAGDLDGHSAILCVNVGEHYSPSFFIIGRDLFVIIVPMVVCRYVQKGFAPAMR
jgi:hypothetical protein